MFHPRCQKQQIIQLSFADDLLLFNRGDTTSAPLLYGCFQEFSQVSGLVANQAKSDIYFGGVPEVIQQQILQHIGFTRGTLPFKYLEVPLSTKRLAIHQCKPLLDKIVEKINSWTVKYLSYAERLQLVQRVLNSIQAFWAQIFLLPKKVMQQVQTIGKRFLWTGEHQRKGKTTIAWDTMRKPKVAGGLNISEIQKWNKASIIKHMWSLSQKKDKLWIKWVHTYYLKGKQTWEV